jgi:hypothetical protein
LRPCRAAGELEELATAVDELDAWLDGSEHGRGWRKLLLTEDLRTQIALGMDADEDAVRRVLDAYASGLKGLELPKFQKVKTALTRWIPTLHREKPEGIPDLLRAASRQVTPVSPNRVRETRARFQSQVLKLDHWSRRGGAERGRWRVAVPWTRLLEPLSRDTDPEPLALAELDRALAGDVPGAEADEVRGARRALLHYADVLAAAADPGHADEAATQLTQLAAGFAEYASKPTSERGTSLARTLGKLRRIGHAPDAAASIRRNFCRPNLFIQLSAPVVAAGFDEPVDDTAPIREVILGTDIRGTGRTRGRVRVELVPDPRRAVLRTVMSGVTESDNVGYNGPVTIYSVSTTRIQTEMLVSADSGGLTAAPAKATARTDATIQDIAAGRCGLVGRVIERAAWKRAMGQQELSEQIGARRAERRAERRVESQAAERLARSNEDFRSKFRDPLLRRDGFPTLLRMTTSETSLNIVALKADDDQLGAPTPPPPLPDSHALAVRCHESLLDNIASRLLAGETLTQERLEATAKQWNDGRVPEKLKRDADEPSWSMTFADVDPVTVAFADGGLRITLRGKRYTRGERVFRGMHVTAAYKIEPREGMLRLVRQGELEIVPPDYKPGQQLSSADVALRRLLRRRFDALFEPELRSEGLVLPGKWKKLGTLPLAAMTGENGWLTAAWRLP